MIKDKKSLRRKKKDAGGDIFLEDIKRGKIPEHIAIIMDGNGRWAKKRGLPRLSGHKAGLKNVREILQAAQDVGVRYMTLYAFSVENWQRPKDEVSGLMKLLKDNIAPELKLVHKNGIKINILGRWRELDPDIVRELEEAVSLTAGNKKGEVNLALNYGGRAELADAAKAISKDVEEGRMTSEDVDEEAISSRMYTSGIPDPDLLIRTSGELRVSNFLLWQIAYAEIWVTPVLWPDFRRDDLFEAIKDYQARRRRYGGLEEDYG